MEMYLQVFPSYWQHVIPIINLRGDAIFKLHKVNSTKYGIKSWRYQAARLWNTIPNNLRNIDSYCSFKRGLRELDLTSLQSLSQFKVIPHNCIAHPFCA